MTAACANFARTFVRSPSAADDVVQETWLAVIRGLDAFEGRSR
jgi:RNA polymerase sigma-70 factor, ECF subfamily